MDLRLWFKKYAIPESALKLARPFWHGLLALLGHFYFGRPSEKLVVIGVTGTNGKSTTVNLIARILEEAGLKTGFTSTVNIKLSGDEKLNNLKMTMPSGWLLHKWLGQMVKNGCKYAVLEVSSEGLAQNRHLGINFDLAVFTNLTPEHIEAHGSFENYKKAKGILFKATGKSSAVGGKLAIFPRLQKTIITNADDQHAGYYSGFPAQAHLSFALKNPGADVRASDLQLSPRGISFIVKKTQFNLQLKGRFDAYNALAAITAAQSQGVALEVCKRALEKIPLVPGRMEVVFEDPFLALVDYAPEPYSLKALYDTIEQWPKKRLIHILGSTGGGRDRSRRKILGQMAAQAADLVIVTNEDPYDDDPDEIISEVAAGALEAGKELGQNLFKVNDRRAAIAKAIAVARSGDMLLVTGKGSEQKMAVADGNYIDWDDRQVLREELEKFKSYKI